MLVVLEEIVCWSFLSVIILEVILSVKSKLKR